MFTKINDSVHLHPWWYIIIFSVVSGISSLFCITNLPKEVFSLILFPISAGSFAAVVNWIFTRRKEKENLCIKPIDEGCIYFPYNDSDGYAAPYRLLVYVSIDNLSPLPISLKEITIQPQGYDELRSNVNVHPADRYELDPYEKIAMNTKQDIFLVASCLIKPIVKLQAYEAIEGYLFFPGCPEIKELSLTAKLKVNTTRGTFEVQLNIQKYSHKFSKWIDGE